MTTVTRKVRKYLHLFEDLVISMSDADSSIREQAEFNLKGFSRMITGEREAMRRLGDLMQQRANMEMSIHTIRADFPHLFDDKKVSMK
jgi:limonene-1,2-epoxide hydrolase